VTITYFVPPNAGVVSYYHVVNIHLVITRLRMIEEILFQHVCYNQETGEGK
jgi:hypothetical protein